MSQTREMLRGDGPLYEAVSRRASPEAHALMDRMMLDMAVIAGEIEREDMIRATVELIYPQFPPFELTQDGLDALVLKARRRDTQARDHMRQQSILAEALAANRRGESVAYLLDFLPRNKKRKKKK
jgi:uncharacterized tellurite resistance protein B-like protein